jgi:hypothetical protein
MKGRVAKHSVPRLGASASLRKSQETRLKGDCNRVRVYATPRSTEHLFTALLAIILLHATFAETAVEAGHYTLRHEELNMPSHKNPEATGQCVTEVMSTSSNAQPVHGPLALHRMTPSLNRLSKRVTFLK